MSLDVYLTLPEISTKKTSGIFVREEGSTVELSAEEWNQRYPDKQITVADCEQEYKTDEVFSANITHNLNKIADECGAYYALWRPDEIGLTKAGQLIAPLSEALNKLKSDPEKYKKFNPPNQWGNYEGLVRFIENYLLACKEYPKALIRVSR